MGCARRRLGAAGWRLAVCIVAGAGILPPLSAAAQQRDEGCWQTWEGTVAPGVSQQRYDPSTTLAWERTKQMADGGLMGQMAGTYYGEIPAPQLGMVSYQYRQYAPNGLFQYQDRTCGNIQGMPCSENYGHGEWAAYRQGDGSVFLMIRVSDMTRTNFCGGGALMIQGNTLLGQDGSRWQRVQ